VAQPADACLAMAALVWEACIGRMLNCEIFVLAVAIGPLIRLGVGKEAIAARFGMAGEHGEPFVRDLGLGVG